MTASVQDVATQLRREITEPTEIAQVLAWIELADMTIRSRYPNLDKLTASRRIDPRTVDLVEAVAVARYARNPEGYTSKSEGIDDYTTTYGLRNASVSIELTDAEWALLTPKDSGAAGAFTITPAGRRKQ